MQVKQELPSSAPTADSQKNREEEVFFLLTFLAPTLPCPAQHTGGPPDTLAEQRTTLGGTPLPCIIPPRSHQPPFPQQSAIGLTWRLSPPKDSYCVQRIEKSWCTWTMGFHSTRKKNEIICLHENGDHYVKQNKSGSEGQILQVSPPQMQNLYLNLCVLAVKIERILWEEDEIFREGGWEEKKVMGSRWEQGVCLSEGSKGSEMGTRGGVVQRRARWDENGNIIYWHTCTNI